MSRPNYMSPTYEAEEAVRPLLKVITYRPGWDFKIFDGQLIIYANVIDSDNPNETIQIMFGIVLPSFASKDYPWDRWLFDQIMTVERHEAQEFFKLNGVKVFDPHG